MGEQEKFAADTTQQVLMFVVPGKPVPKPSVRGRNFTIQTKREVVMYRELVTRIAKSAADTMVQAGIDLTWLHEAVRVDVEWFFRPPHRSMDRIGRPHGVKPDRDNLEKLLYDAMQDAGVLRGGDQRVSAGEVRKTWDRVPRAVVVVRPDNRAAVRRDGPVGPSVVGW